MTNKYYNVCARCVMDTSALDITFDKYGVCNYCSDFLSQSAHILQQDAEAKAGRLSEFVDVVKAHGKGKSYDCVVGVSGGVDSSWVLVKAVEMGLRPLAVHMDNGWNSELAQNNIANLVNGLGVDLYTHVIDWEEYRALMQAFFDADVIDVEILYDNAMLGVNYQLAARHGIRHILFGTNLATEGIKIPPAWVWLKNDARNIRAIAKRNGVKLKTFPLFSTLDLIWKKTFNRIRNDSILNLIEYRKSAVLEVLERGHGYKRYPYKHYESIFTRFYQGYILPKKFGVDKRRVHLSTLVVTEQMTRDEALGDLEGIPYASQESMDCDIDYFLKKMGWSKQELQAYIERPEVAHNIYSTENRLFEIASEAHLLVKRFKNS